MVTNSRFSSMQQGAFDVSPSCEMLRPNKVWGQRMDRYREAWERWNDYDGRSNRELFFWFILPNILVGMVLRGVDVMMGGQGWLSLLYGVLVLVPFVPLAVRRMHDINRSGWWALCLLVPIVGTLLYLGLALIEGDNGANDYGVEPD